MKKLLSEMFRYVFAGGSGMILDLVVFLGLTHLGIPYVLAALVSFLIGMFLNYTICSFWVFRQNKSPFWSEKIFRHYLSGSMGLVVNIMVLILLQEKIHFPSLLWSKIIASGFSFGFNFLLLKYFAFQSFSSPQK